MKLAFLPIASILIPLVTSTPVLGVDIDIAEDTHVRSSLDTSRHSQHVLGSEPVKSAATIPEQIRGWMFGGRPQGSAWMYLNGTEFWSRPRGKSPWDIRGTLAENFPVGRYIVDFVIMTSVQPQDFVGIFNGTAGGGKIQVLWAKSGATMFGKSSVGDIVFSGESKIVYED